jgi:hypothetical protein
MYADFARNARLLSGGYRIPADDLSVERFAKVLVAHVSIHA